MTVVLAFDGDEAGEKALESAVLTVLDAPDDIKDFIRGYSFQGKDYSEALKSLTNESLAEEYRWYNDLANNKELADFWRDFAREQATTCMKLIQQRSVRNEQLVEGRISSFNKYNTITDVMGRFGHQARPGRTNTCPMHDDSTPSLSISKDDGRAYCFNQSCVLWNDGHGVDAFELNKILKG